MKAALTFLVVAALGLAGCDGKHDDGHDHGSAAAPAGGHGAEAAVAAPATLKDAAAKLEAAHGELGAIVKDGDLSKAHAVADRIAKLAAALPELATRAGLPAADVKDVNLASKDLQSLFPVMDEAGDAGKRADAQAVFAKYAAPLATVKKHAGHSH